MEALSWTLVVILSIVVVVLLVRRRSAAVPSGSSTRELMHDEDAARSTSHTVVEGPDSGTVSRGASTDVAAGGAEAARSAPAPSPAVATAESVRRTTREFLEQVLAYLERGPLARLRAAEEAEGDSLPAPVLDALDALEDLAFYGAIPDGTPARTDLADLVRDVTREYGEQHGVRIRVSGPERPVSFEVAPEWFKDILYLVLSNADHFGGEGAIEIRLSGGQAVPAVVEVRDEGEGFTEDALANAFEPFWTTDPRAPGLGLFHCRILVDRMGGQLDIDNHPDGGGRVRLLLPEAPPASEGE